jgi:hypothetical protein
MFVMHLVQFTFLPLMTLMLCEGRNLRSPFPCIYLYSSVVVVGGGGGGGVQGSEPRLRFELQPFTLIVQPVF